MHLIAEMYKGFVLAEREQNLYHDSYFWLTVWNPETSEIEEFQYAATAYGGAGPMHHETVQRAIEDAHDGVKFAAQKRRQEYARIGRANVLNYVMNECAGYYSPFKGDTVRVFKGRKVRKGLVGKVLSTSKRTFGYNNERTYVFIDCGADGYWTVDCENVECVQHSQDRLQELFDLTN